MVGDAAGLSQDTGQRGVEGQGNGAWMLYLAEYRDETLRNAGHIDDIVAAQTQVSQGIAVRPPLRRETGFQAR